MASRLSETSDSSSDEEAPAEYSSLKRKSDYSFHDSPENRTSKKPCLDSSYNENYYNRESEDEIKEDDHCFEKPNATSFYDINQSNNKFDDDDDDSEGKSQSSSYYHDSGASGHEDDFSKSQNDSLKLNKPNSTNLGSKEKNEPSENKGGSIAERMMKKWGFERGKGLGRELQGIADPVTASTQKGRRGLGLELKELEKAHIEFNPDEEIVEVQEELLWLQNQHNDVPSINELIEWESERKVGKQKETIDGETIFCDVIVVKNIVNSKSVFDRLDKHEMRGARTRSNPFETIRGSIFLNRAAVKMANIDKACDFMFTKPSNLQPDELLYFADVCAGPGGFSEYVLWRRQWRSKGFGFTLKNENDFKLDDFHAGPCESFHPYYGPKENGDVYDPDNQIAFRDLVMNQTDGHGVHFMMADGGFSVEGQENIQEILSKQLYLCQCLVALMIVRPGGHFVTKVFDLFTPFSAGLVYIMNRCFNRISIFKPNTSRPANSERYLICQGKLSNINHIVDYLFKTNKKLLKGNKMNDILELVPVAKLLLEKQFFDYLKDSNEVLGQKQIVGLKKIAAYTENKDLIESRQKTIREECLKFWDLPDQTRSVQQRMNATAKAQSLLQDSFNVLEKSSYKNAMKLTKENIFNTILANEFDWLCTPCSSGEDVFSSGTEDKFTTFYLGMGRSQVYKYDKNHWEQVRNTNVALPRDTLVYGEMVAEIEKEDRSQTKTYGLHIIDAFTLGTENVSQMHYLERLKCIQLFCKAIWKPTDRTFSPVRVKEMLPICYNLSEKLTLSTKSMKNGTKVLGYFPKIHSYENDGKEAYYVIPKSIVFIKVTEEPWAYHKSSSSQRMYFFNKKNHESRWETPDSAKANFAKVIQSRVIWNWQSDKSLTMDDFMECLKQKNTRRK